MAHLKKFVYGKFDIDTNLFQVDIMYKVKTIVLLDHYTLMDVAYIYTWKRDAPMRFYFSVKESHKPVIKVRKTAKVTANTNGSTVITKEEVLSDHETPQLNNDAMTIVHLPTPSINTDELPLTQIKEEDVEVDSVTPHATNETKTFEIIPQPNLCSSNGSGQELSKTDKLKITIVSKGSRDKQSNGDLKSPGHVKSTKEKKEQPVLELKEERKIENIKLKIDLSKQNSVTIINMSDPDRKEIVKPVKPEKEWKVKSKKDKEKGDSPKSSPSSERKRKTPSPLTVPPLTIKAERISPLAKTSPKQLGISKVTSVSPPQLSSEEEQKSQFLKSFALTPIKDVKLESPEKHHTPPKQSPTKLTKCNFAPTENSINAMNPPTTNVLPKLGIASKRKSKEPVKAIPKKQKFSAPLPPNDFKIKLPPMPNLPSNKYSKSFPPASLPVSSPTSGSSEKSLMPPPPPIPFMKPLNALARQKPQKPLNKFAPPGSLTPHPMQIIQPAPPGNRTPIAKRYQPILPKASRPNPFANIPTDVNKILKDAGTEIKSISSSDIITPPPKVYGPKTPNINSMGPPPAPVQTTQSNNRSTASQNSNKSSNSNNYLNLALFNASKSKGNEVPPGCRTPMYSPNSPIYSPSSPQYAPNYNIPTVPTYKYTPKPSSGSSSYLQSVLGSNSQMSNLFPAPPTKRINAENAPTSQLKRSNSPMKSEPPKRVYPFAKSPSPIEDPPEKQLKVKSLLTSCNINIPSSLSITITREDSESQSNNTSYPKHKSPVNNYIEILKLPDQSAESTADIHRRPSPPKQNNSTPPTTGPPKKENTNTQSQLQAPQHAPLNSTTNIPSAQLKNLSLNFSKPSVTIHNVSTTNTISKTAPPNSKNTKTTTTNVSSTTTSTNASAGKPSMQSPQMVGPNQLGTAVKNHSKPPTEITGGAMEKKTPSPEKRPLDAAAAAGNQMESKSPDSATASKKFRHILPRQNPTGISEIVPPKVNPGNIIGTYSSPSGVAVKVHANKKVSPPTKKSPTMPPPTVQPNSTTTNNISNNASLPKTSPNSTCTVAKPTSTTSSAPLPKSSPNMSNNAANGSKSKKTSSASSSISNSVSSSSSSNITNGLNKLMPPVPAPAPAVPHPALNVMSNLTHSMQPLVSGIPNMPPAIPNMPAHLAAAANAANQAEISKFLKDNLLRAQVQAAAANQSNMFYSYANAAAQMGQFTPSMYNYQQAYIMEQLTRMQRAGNDAFMEYMQKLKGSGGSGSEKIPALPMSVGIGAGVGAAYENRNATAPAKVTTTTSSAKITSPTAAASAAAAYNGNQQTSKIQPSTKTK